MGGGAWGLGLFQSDFDYDHIQDLTWEAGLLELEQEDAKKQGKKAVYAAEFHRVSRDNLQGQDYRQVEHKRADQSKPKDDDVYYSIYANLCSSPKRARQYLEKTDGQPGKISALQRMITRHQALAAAEKDSPKRPGYVCVLLAACAMSLGCKLPADFLQHIRATYAHRTRVGLMRDAVKDMSKALFGPNKYKNDGTPYDFGKKSMDYVIKSGGPPPEDCYHPRMINVPSPSGVHPAELLQQAMLFGHFETYAKTKQYCEQKFNDALGGEPGAYGEDVCGGCGAEEGEDGKALVKCAKCMGRKYCGKDCQKKDWAEHKKVCKVPGL